MSSAAVVIGALRVNRKIVHRLVQNLGQDWEVVKMNPVLRVNTIIMSPHHGGGGGTYGGGTYCF